MHPWLKSRYNSKHNQSCDYPHIWRRKHEYNVRVNWKIILMTGQISSSDVIQRWYIWNDYKTRSYSKKPELQVKDQNTLIEDHYLIIPLEKYV